MHLTIELRERFLPPAEGMNALLLWPTHLCSNSSRRSSGTLDKLAKLGFTKDCFIGRGMAMLMAIGTTLHMCMCA